MLLSDRSACAGRCLEAAKYTLGPWAFSRIPLSHSFSLNQCLGNNERCQAGGWRQDSGQDSRACGLKEPMSLQWLEMTYKLWPGL